MLKTIQLILIISFLTSCGNSDKIVTKRKVVNGVEYVRSSNPSDPALISLELNEIMRVDTITINPPDRGEDYNKVFTMDDSGNLYILDTKGCSISKYDMSGNLLEKTGREGQGPGEFQAPNEIYLDSDSIKVISNAYKRVDIYTKELTYLVTRELDILSKISSAIKTDKNTFISSLDYRELNGSNLTHLTTYSRKDIINKYLIFDNGSDLLETIYHKEFTKVKELDPMLSYMSIFTTDQDGKNLFFVDNSDREFKISQFNFELGSIAKVIEKRYIPIEKPLMMKMSEFNKGDYWLSIFNLEVDRDGNLWIFSAEDYPTTIDMVLGSDCKFQIFNSDGAYLGKVVVPTPPKAVNISFIKDKMISYDAFEDRLVIYDYKLVPNEG